ncbi:MAG: hypothetical protein FWC64_02090 [Treponema sp.]|nr:hypothetical protein [Treponema sp.]
MPDNNDYPKTLADALKARADILEKNELVKLKELFRAYHVGFASLYNLYVKKGLIHEDPYKQEAKIAELEVPSSAPFSEADKMDQLTRRLANYDNQLDFLVNFYQFSVEFLTIDRLKRILALVKYIDWVRLSPDSEDPVSKAVAEMTGQIKTGTDSLTMSVITESLSNLNRSFNPILANLKALADYQRELYKLELRDVTAGMSPEEAASLPQLKRKLSQDKPGLPFYPDLVGEALKEDYSDEGPALREAVLKKLQVDEAKPKEVKAPVSFKGILLDGIQGLGGTAATFSEILAKLDENQIILQNRKQSFFEKLKRIFRQMFNKEREQVIYEVEYVDPVKGIPVREKVDFYSFRGELERKIRTLGPLTVRGPAASKLESIQEEQLTGFLERNIREVQSLHKTLGALDEFFKAAVDRADREKIRGIKPELGTIKNAIVRANSKRYEYSAQKEEEEQLRRLGVGSET